MTINGRSYPQRLGSWPMAVAAARIGATLVAASLFAVGCSENPAAPPPLALDLGAPVDVATTTVPSSGGTLVVETPGDVLDGLTIEIPDGAYPDPRAYDVGYRPITAIRNGDSAFKPLTPLIMISNGGGYSEEAITLTIPCTVPDGDFPMAFLYDPASGEIEGMPLLSYDENSVTVYTANFAHSAAMAAGKPGAGAAEEGESGIVVSSISERLLESYREISSTFKPGVDDWQFVNWGSYVSNGHCAGQTLGSLWYFMQRKSRGDGQLNGRFDNGDGINATPKLWQDDLNAYYFCAVLQKEYWESSAARIFNGIQSITPDQITYNAIKYAMIVTGEPVYVTAGGKINGTFTRHALTVYRIQDGTVYIADPNDPGDLERKIEFSGGGFSPYKFGSKGATFPGIDFPTIEYIAKSSVIDYALVRKHYHEMLDGTIGRNLFPAYTIEVESDAGGFVPLTDGHRTAKRIMKLRVTSPDVTFIPDFEAYREDGTRYTASGNEISLPLGRHRLGVYVFDKNKHPYGYVGFRWFNVEGWEELPAGGGRNEGECSCTLTMNGAPKTITGSLFSMGPFVEHFITYPDTAFVLTAQFPDGAARIVARNFTGPGTYTLYNSGEGGSSSISDASYRWFPTQGTNTITITDLTAQVVRGSFEFTNNGNFGPPPLTATGTFACGR